MTTGRDWHLKFWAKNGDEVTLEQWVALFGDMEYKRIGSDYVGDWWISTVWLGSDHGYGYSRRPLFFETMVFGERGEGPALDEYMERWATEEEARRGHEQVVAMIRALDEVGNVMPQGRNGD